MSFQQISQKLNKTPFNVFDVIVILGVIMPLLALLRKFDFVVEGNASIFFGMVLSPVVFIYMLFLRPKIIQFEFVKKIIPQPLPEELRGKLNFVSIFSAMLIAVGAMAALMTIYIGTIDVENAKEVNHQQIQRRAEKKTESEKMVEIAGAVGSASSERPNNQDVSSIEDAMNEFEKNKDQRALKYAKEMESQIISESNMNKQKRTQRTLLFLLLSVTTIAIGAVIDKINNRYRISSYRS